MATATQQGTYVTGTNFTPTLHNAELNELYTNLNSITNAQINASAAIAFSKLESSAWTDNTPTWTASINPAIGNGTIVGRYVKIGRIVVFSFSIIMGGTTTYGSGQYAISIPYTAATSTDNVWKGSLIIYDSSATTFYVGACSIGSAGTTLVMHTHGANGNVNETRPITLASGDEIRGTIVYESAS